MHRFARRIAVVPLAAVAISTTGLAAPPAAAAEPPGHDRVVSPVPTTATPDISNGYPNAIHRIGDRVVVGGTFDGEVVDRPTGQPHSRRFLFAFDADTGLVDEGFAPSIGAEVRALLPGPTPDTVYVGGRMNNVNGAQGYSKLVLLDLTDGSLVGSFRAPPMNGAVTAVHEVDGRLLVGGTFTTVGDMDHGGLVALDPLTGARLDYLDIHLTEHHNYDGTGAQGAVGVEAFDVNPDGTAAVVIGNFKRANDLDRDQALMLDLTGPQAEIRDWHTEHYQPACSRNSFDKWVRDVSFSPDGSFFVIATTGGPFRDTLCDTAARWETAATGTGLNPTWVNWSGGDTLLSVAVTETAVYVGGHQRWMNNHLGRDSPETGAVGRPGIAVLDPASGVPVSWNAGRHPRGFGATVIYPTPDGLYVGSDTDFIGNFRYRREKIAFFPLAGGVAPPAGVAATLPADIYFTDVEVDAGSGIARRFYDGTTLGPVVPVGGVDGTAWGELRGAFLVDDTLFYGMSDGSFWRRGFDGATIGPPEELTPHLDPDWDGVPTSSGDSTYSGAPTSGFATAMADLRAMYYTGGRIFYTRAGDNALHWRWFSPENGLAGSREFSVPGSGAADSLNNLSDSSGLLFLADDNVYWVRAADGHLVRRALVDNGPGTEQVTTADSATRDLAWAPDDAEVVSGPAVDGVDWRTPGAFLRTE